MDIRFRMPVDVRMCDECVKGAADAIAAYGKKAIIVTDGIAAVRNGAMDDMARLLRERGIDFCVYDRVESNPTVECVREITKEAVNFGAEMVIAIGGGSSMDAGKAVSILVTQNREVSDEDMVSGNFEPNTIPLIAIPTTSGTGSEVTPFSMLTSIATKRKINLNAPTMYARLALLDPKYTMTVPWNVSVNTALDAISHAIESCITVTSTPLIRAIAYESLSNAGIILHTLADDEQLSISTRRMMMYDSVLAGITVGQTRTSGLHGISYSLTYHRHIPHGRAIGLLLVPYLRFTSEHQPLMVGRIIQAMGFGNLDDLEKVLSFLITNKETFSKEEIALWAEEAVALRNIGNCIVPPTKKDILNILESV